MKLRSALTSIALLAGWIATATADDLSDGLGQGPNSVMRMKFEVTFMKIDVANIEAHFPPATATALTALVDGEKFSDEHAREIGARVIASDTLMISMEYLRDSDYGKFIKGVRRVFEAARKSGTITEAEQDSMLVLSEEDTAPLVDHEFKKGERFIYRIDGSRVHMVYRTVDGEVLLDRVREGSQWARGVKGGFFSREARFQKPLVKSLFATG